MIFKASGLTTTPTTVHTCCTFSSVGVERDPDQTVRSAAFTHRFWPCFFSAVRSGGSLGQPVTRAKPFVILSTGVLSVGNHEMRLVEVCSKVVPEALFEL